MADDNPLVFISHSSDDLDLATGLSDWLRQAGIHVWFDKTSLRAGDNLVSSVESALQAAAVIISLVSKAYLASPWCQTERSNALYRSVSDDNVRIIPLILDDLALQDMPVFLRSRLAISCDRKSPEPQFREVVRTILGAFPESGMDSAALPRRTEFVGRTQEIEAVLVSFRHPRSWLTAIEGIAGIGKTSLAIEAAHLAIDQDVFQAVVFITAQHSDISIQDVLVSLLRTLNGRGALKKYDQMQMAQNLLRETRTLLIIDNFDTISRGRQAIGWFLSNLPSPSKALITSRRLERLEATHVTLGQMQSKDAVDLLRREWIKNYPSQAETLNFQVVSERTGGNPLFMKLAIAQVKRGWSLSQILEFLDRAKGEPFNFYEDLWSRIDRDTQTTLAALAIFAAPARWDALLVTTGLTDERLEEALVSLVEMFLVEPSEAGSLLRYYYLHPLTKKFAEQKLRLETQLQADLERRFVAHFLGLTRKHAGRAWNNYVRLDKEQKNIFAAMDLLATSQDWKALVDITMQVRHFVIRQDRTSIVPPNRLREYFAQARFVCEKGLAAAIKANDSKNECRLLLELGNIEIIRGMLDSARGHLTLCVQKCRQIGYTKREIMALRRLAHIEVRQNRRDAARRLYEESLALAEKVEDEIGIARALRSLGDLAFEEDNVDGAEALYARSVECANADLDPVGMPRVARRLGNIKFRKRQFEAAAIQFKAVVALYLEKYDLSGACYSLFALARAQEERRRLRDALHCSLGSLRALGSVHKELWPWMLGEIETLPATISASKDELQNYVPPVDRTITLCFQVIFRVRNQLGAGFFNTEKESIVALWTAWEEDWTALIKDVVERCDSA